MGHDRYMISFQGIHVGYFAKSGFTGWFDGCGKKNAAGQFTMAFHDTIVDYLKTIQSEPQYCVKIVSSLPKQVTERYYTERNATGYEIPLDQAHISSN